MRLGIAETDLSGERACKFCPLHHGKTLLCVLVMCFLFKKFIVLFLPSYFQVHLFGFIKFIVSLVNFLLSCLPWPLPFYTFPCKRNVYENFNKQKVFFTKLLSQFKIWNSFYFLWNKLNLDNQFTQNCNENSKTQ